MGQLCSLHHVSLRYGDHTIFRSLSFTLCEGQRIGVIGANGVGKSTLLRLLLGEEHPDDGTVSRRKDLRVAIVPQAPHFAPEAGVLSVLMDHLAAVDPGHTEEEHRIQARMTLDKLGFADPEVRVGTLSGGWLKRVAIAQALVSDPELLLLDEPTNHLDIEGCLWLEEWLRNCRLTCVIVTHDRAFLQAACTSIAEIHPAYPDNVLMVDGDYRRYLERRAEWQTGRQQSIESLESKVRRELEWLARGPKARALKDSSRIDNAHKIIDELSEMKALGRETSTLIDFSASGRKTKRLLVARGVGKSVGGRRLFANLDLILSPGMRLGLVGGNGVGKTTLLRVLAGELAPDEGELQLAPNLRLVHVDQYRAGLDPALSLARALSPDGDAVRFKGQSIHINGWARRFGFDERQLPTPVGKLSGGEQAKVQIARLMLLEADVLLLDEPTNDLDLPTLDVLEANLRDFPGAIVLVTHDRYMLDELSTLLLGLDGKGGSTFVAELAQWQQWMEAQREAGKPVETKKAPKPKEAKAPTKLSYLEQREFDGLEGRLGEAEAKAEALRAALNDPALASDAAEVEANYRALQALEPEINALYARWEELDAKRARG